MNDDLSEEMSGTIEDHIETCRQCEDLLKRMANKSENNLISTFIVRHGDGQIGPALDQSHRIRMEELFFPGVILNDRYTLHEEIGSGTMGVVFRGRDSNLRRPVAVKVISPLMIEESKTREEDLRRSFEEEACLGANLLHSAIVTVFDFGYYRGFPFAVFEYLPGKTLRDVLKVRGRMPLIEVRAIISSLAQALDFAHECQIVHRDLKPENIRATEHGEFKILDLGLATKFDSANDCRPAGTPLYMSPEQCEGKASDGRADQYALGVIVYEMLCGHWPFSAKTLKQLFEMHVKSKPQPLHDYVPELPGSVCDAVLRALKKDPNERFASCREFAVALGCQLAKTKTSMPAVLFEFDVSMKPTSFTFVARRQSLSARIALTTDSFWLLHRGQIKQWPLSCIAKAQVRRNALSLICKNNVIKEQYKIAISEREWKGWNDALHAAMRDNIPKDNDDTVDPLRDPVVLLRRSPNVHYGVLSIVEAKGHKRQRIRDEIRLRAAMMDADAVIDTREERVIGFYWTWRTISGTAVKANDEEALFEFKTRAFSDELKSTGAWMLAAVATLWTYWTLMTFSFIGSAGLLVWPLIIAVLVRCLKWPQLLRAAALAFLSLALFGLAFGAGSLIGSVTSGQVLWATLGVVNISGHLPFIVICPSLAKRCWKNHASYRDIVPMNHGGPSIARVICGYLVTACSVVYALVLIVGAALTGVFGRFGVEGIENGSF